MRRVSRFLTSLVVLALMTMPGSTASLGAGAPNTWAKVAPLPYGVLWSAVASAAGMLYVFGGLDASGFVSTIEAYDPGTNSWTSMGNMPYELSGIPSATTGPDGLIYIYGVAGEGSTSKPVMLVYHPAGKTWSNAPVPPGVDEFAVLVTGQDGTVYAVGGRQKDVPVAALSAYHVASHTWTSLAPDPTIHDQPGVAVGGDGRIYVVGGDKTMAAVDAYDPHSKTWASVAPLPTPRSLPGVVPGSDGRVYAMGGMGRCSTAPCNEVDVYDPQSNTWREVAPLPHGRWNFAAADGPDGRIYVLGGYITTAEVPSGSLTTVVEAYTVVPAGQPLPAPPLTPRLATQELAPMPTARDGLGVALSGGKIYAIGGQTVSGPRPNGPAREHALRTVEAYDPTTNTWHTAPSLPAPRVGAGVTTGTDGRIYVFGGVARQWYRFHIGTDLRGLNSVEIYDPRTSRWSAGPPMPDGRYALAAVTGKDGRIYTIGGATDCATGDLATARTMKRPALRPMQVYIPPQLPGGYCDGAQSVRAFNPRTNTWITLALLHTGRILPAAAVAPDGRIYVFGGTMPPSKSFEVYDPATNRWTQRTGGPRIRDNGFAAATAGDGRIDLIGGCIVTPATQTGFNEYCGPPSPVDAYDPRTNKWTEIGPTLNVREALAATTGPDGRVYAVGGGGDGGGHLLEVIRQGG